ncbi:MAG: hypothetical protein EHM23_15545 [Acidobacteria bacterium]|nr:MAG: hypothetical protein EHM23_15545 [Acidobacteriota bacterium]
MGCSLKIGCLAVVVGLLCLSCTTPDRPKAVVIVLIDSLRPDHINAYGYRDRQTTPGLDTLFAGGVTFSDAYSNAPWTVPSVMSLMTSLYPSAHGYNLEAHLLHSAPPGLGSKLKTLPEIFREAGYATAAFTADGGVSAAYGFNRGFETFAETPPVNGSDVEMVVAKSLAWLKKNGHRPFFLLLHTYEVHLPHTHEAQQTGLNTDETVRQNALQGYDADLRFADKVLARLWESLRSQGIYEDSIIVVLSDHGEALHERTLFGRGDDHGYHLHDELLRVPLAIVAPGRIERRGAWVRDPVQLVDVLPTLVELAGLERPTTPLQGASLVPLIRGERAPLRPLFAEAPYQGPGWIAVRFDRFKYLAVPKKHVHEGPEMWWDGDPGTVPEALYDLRSDPGETASILARNPDQLARLRRYAENMRQSSEQIALLTRPERQQRTRLIRSS